MYEVKPLVFPAQAIHEKSHCCSSSLLLSMFCPELFSNECLQDHKVVDQIEGADAAALTQKVSKHFGSSAASVTGPIAPLPNARIASNGAASTSGAANAFSKQKQSQQALQTKLDKLVHSAPVLLFMKGTPTEPRCGFSAKVVNALQQAGIDFTHFDILSDDAVRQGLKVGVSHTCFCVLD